MSNLIQERQYFANLSQFSEKIIDQLTEKIKNKEKINSGDSFIIELDDTHDLEIKFYKTYSKRAREFIKKTGNGSAIEALFFPIVSDKADATIEIYINHAKTYYYRDRDSIEIVNNRLPKFIKEILRHEITHVNDNILSSFANKKPDISSSDDIEEYVNSDDEVNAFFNQIVSSEINDNHLIKYYISIGNTNSAMNALFLKIKRHPAIHKMSDENKKWILKTAYTTIKELVERNSIAP